MRPDANRNVPRGTFERLGINDQDSGFEQNEGNRNVPRGTLQRVPRYLTP